jgi:hypothetical protein
MQLHKKKNQDYKDWPAPDYNSYWVKKNARPYGAHYGDEEGGSEAEDVIEANENVADDNPSEINGYYADKIGKYCKNCNSTFESGNKLYQHLRNCKISDNIRRAIKIKTKSTIIVPDKNISILKSSRKFKFNSGNYFRIFHYATVKILLN